jgi:hypothetical protein
VQFGLGLRDARARTGHGLLRSRRRSPCGFNRRGSCPLRIYRLSVLLLRDFIFFG